MSSAAAASCTTRNAARCARAQCARNSASIASCEPACASRTQARSRRREGRPERGRPRRASAIDYRCACQSRNHPRPPPSTGGETREVHPVSSTLRCRTRGQPGRRPARGSLMSHSRLPQAAGPRVAQAFRRAGSASSPRWRASLVAGIAIAWPFVVRDRNAGRARASGDRRPAQGRLTGPSCGRTSARATICSRPPSAPA